MKGVVLAGGKGTRLQPLTNVTNKHLIPVFNNPMIDYPISTLKSFGLNEVCLVTGGDHISDFMRYLGSGSNFGIDLTYKVQDSAKGIADALLTAENFFKKEKVVTILGDNIFEKVELPKEALKDEYAYIFIKEVDNPESFGIATVNDENIVIEIIEKPKNPKSNLAVTGLYIYPPDVFDFIKTLKPSDRGELELTDVNNYYLNKGKLKTVMLKGFWSDAGTIPSLIKSSLFSLKSTDPEMFFKMFEELKH